MSRIVAAVTLTLSLVGCEGKRVDQSQYAQSWQVDSINNEVSALAERVSAIERQDEALPYKLSDSGFGFIETNTGGGTLQWIGSKANGNGVSLRLKFGNPSSATWNSFTIIGRYGKLQANGEPDQSSTRPFMVDVDRPIPAGSWKTVSIQLDGPKSEDVGFLYVRSISISNVGLKAE